MSQSQLPRASAAPVYLTVTRLTETRRHPAAPDKISLDVEVRADNGKGAFFILSDGLRQRVPWKVGDRLLCAGRSLYHPALPNVDLFAQGVPWPLVPLPPSQPLKEPKPMNNIIAMPHLPASLDLAKHPLTMPGVRMTSQDIATLTGKRHDNVKRTIETLAESGVIRLPQIEDSEKINNLGLRQPVKHYVFDLAHKRDSFVVVAQLSPEFTAKLVDRWQELEGQAAPIALPGNYLEALKALTVEVEKRESAETRAWEAEATKSWIGSRREASAMATASAQARRAHALEIELDRAKEYATVKRMEMLYHGQKFNWHLLKSAGNDLGIPPIDVFDPNFGTVKSYHADVWREAYALEIPN